MTCMAHMISAHEGCRAEVTLRHSRRVKEVLNRNQANRSHTAGMCYREKLQSGFRLSNTRALNCDPKCAELSLTLGTPVAHGPSRVQYHGRLPRARSRNMRLLVVEDEAQLARQQRSRAARDSRGELTNASAPAVQAGFSWGSLGSPAEVPHEDSARDGGRRIPCRECAGGSSDCHRDLVDDSG